MKNFMVCLSLIVYVSYFNARAELDAFVGGKFQVLLLWERKMKTWKMLNDFSNSLLWVDDEYYDVL